MSGAGRRLCASLRAIETRAGDRACGTYRNLLFGSAATSIDDADLVDAAASPVREGRDIRRLEQAPPLLIPAAQVYWMQPQLQQQDSRSFLWACRDTTTRYDAVPCAPGCLNAQGISLARTMVRDHLLDTYERALTALAYFQPCPSTRSLLDADAPAKRRPDQDRAGQGQGHDGDGRAGRGCLMDMLWKE